MEIATNITDEESENVLARTEKEQKESGGTVSVLQPNNAQTNTLANPLVITRDNFSSERGNLITRPVVLRSLLLMLMP
ncbi:hypothetical protein EZ449_13355 [Pedobacter frigidisoli]|uniref:Uncharacterized protein n=1 Tax=Pedobacter frigidisoli TaxID=2530455 RepID=A0A4V2MMS1_9SPHI|nr:hypothetical protein [Pedobacter frigidisoli]TCD08382.1 hypothetical protein EZ449_13355 [Pedobacter frigidisoli]